MDHAIVIVLHDHRADPVATAAIGHLRDWAQAGLIGPFWSVSNEDTRRATLIDSDGPHPVELLQSIAGRRHPTISRAVSIATSALDDVATSRLASAATRLADDLRRHGPAGRPVVEVRVIAPDDLQQQSALTGLLSPVAEANIVLVPEDRISDASFSVPVGLTDAETFAGHVATELATTAGLWSGMDSSRVDDSRAGVIDHGDTSVVFARSLVRVASGPSLPLHEALAPGGNLPVPPGTEAAPDPRRAAVAHAERLFANTPDLHVRHVADLDERRADVGVRAIGSRLLGEAKLYVQHLPRQLRDGAVADFEHVASEAVTNAMGEDSIFNVVWPGKTSDDESTTDAFDVDRVRRSLEQRSLRAEPPTFDQQVWAGLLTDVLSAVDGGAPGNVTAPPAMGAQRLAIVDPAAIGPNPSNGLGAVTTALAREDLEAEQGTLLGRFSALIRRQVAAANDEFDRAVQRIDRDVLRLRRPIARAAAVLSWTMAGLVAAFTLLIAIGLRGAELLAMESWSTPTVTTFGVIVAIAALVAGAACLAAALRGRSNQSSRPWFICGATLIGGLILSWPFSTRQYQSANLGPRQLANIIQVATIAAILLIIIVIAARQRTRRGNAAARIAGAVLIVYVTMAIIGLVVRRGGWYQAVADDVLRSWTLHALVVVLTALLLNFLLVVVLRVRERLTIGAAAQRLHHSVREAEQAMDERIRLTEALRQFHGTAAALDAMVWWPCGRPAGVEGDDVDRGHIESPVRKLGTFEYEFSDRGRMGVIARIRRKIAEPGWLQHQYAVAVEAFRPEFAFWTGSDLDVIAHRRPECDPSIEADGVGSRMAGEGPRWRFATMLFEGDFDADLRVSASRLALDDVLEQYFQRVDGVAGERSTESGLNGFADALLAGEPPRLPAQLFSRMSLPVADDPRTRYTSTIWWPTTALTCPQTTAHTEHLEIEHDGPRGMVLAFVRTDWSEPFALHRLPLAPPEQDPQPMYELALDAETVM